MHTTWWSKIENITTEMRFVKYVQNWRHFGTFIYDVHGMFPQKRKSKQQLIF